MTAQEICKYPITVQETCHANFYTLLLQQQYSSSPLYTMPLYTVFLDILCTVFFLQIPSLGVFTCKTYLSISLYRVPLYTVHPCMFRFLREAGYRDVLLYNCIETPGDIIPVAFFQCTTVRVYYIRFILLYNYDMSHIHT